MKILIVEDDPLQAEWTYQNLKKEFPYAQVDVINTESEFRNRLEEIASNPPDVIMIDVMLRWTDPSPHMPPPPIEVKEQGFYRAGLRCEQLLSEDNRTSKVPIIIYTVLEEWDLSKELKNLRSNVAFLSKESDPNTLFQHIQELIRS